MRLQVGIDAGALCALRRPADPGLRSGHQRLRFRRKLLERTQFS